MGMWNPGARSLKAAIVVLVLTGPVAAQKSPGSAEPSGVPKKRVRVSISAYETVVSRKSHTEIEDRNPNIAALHASTKTIFAACGLQVVAQASEEAEYIVHFTDRVFLSQREGAERSSVVVNERQTGRLVFSDQFESRVSPFRDGHLQASKAVCSALRNAELDRSKAKSYRRRSPNLVLAQLSIPRDR